MALLGIDSFDHYDTATMNRKGWINEGGNAATAIAIGAYGRNSTQGLRFNLTTNQNARTSLSLDGISGTTAIVGFALKADALPDSLPIVTFLNGSTGNILIALTTSGAINVRRGDTVSGGTSLASSAGGVISTGIWYYVEVKVLFSDTVGTYEVRVNGANVVSGTGADTISSGSAAWTGIKFGQSSAVSSSTSTWAYDDLYICDGSGAAQNDFLGDHRIVCVLPNAAGTHSDLTPTSGDNYTNVDDNPPDGATSQVSSNTANDVDTYNFTALGVTGDVQAVQAVYYATADQAGVRTLGHVTRISTTDYADATTISLGSDWEFQRFVMPVSPATSTAWTITEIDGAEFGPKIAT